MASIKHIEKIKGVEVYFLDYNPGGNSRFIIHYFDFLTKKERADLSVLDGSDLAEGRARRCGFKPYRGAAFGGGFVITASDPAIIIDRIFDEIKKAKASNK